MEQLKEQTEEIVGYCDAIIHDRLRRRSSESPSAVPWKDDAEVKAAVSDFRAQSSIVSHSAVKLALLVTTPRPGDKSLAGNLGVLAAEIGPQLSLLYNIFLKLSTCQLAECLFDEIAQCVRSLLGRFLELILSVIAKNRDAINLSAGEITKITEDTASALPLANKAAYKRFLLKKGKGVKEVLTEFEEYIVEAKEALQAQGGQSTASAGEEDPSHVFTGLSLREREEDAEEDEEDEDDMDERDYTASEVVLVEAALQIINTSFRFLKVVIVVLPHVLDSLTEEQHDEGNLWVAQTVAWTETLENCVVDLGAALYPPVTADCEELRQAKEGLFAALRQGRELFAESVTGRFAARCDDKMMEQVQTCLSELAPLLLQ